jgi:hypothetical protein
MEEKTVRGKGKRRGKEKEGKGKGKGKGKDTLMLGSVVNSVAHKFYPIADVHYKSALVEVNPVIPLFLLLPPSSSPSYLSTSSSFLSPIRQCPLCIPRCILPPPSSLLSCYTLPAQKNYPGPELRQSN